MKIGVFDSGIGGLSVANAIRKRFPDYDVEFVNDAAHLPYGSKNNEQLLTLAVPILQRLAEGCDVIVIACNTLTTNVIGQLRECIPVPLVGIEPMIKPAAKLTESDVIAVCATPATLRSDRYAYLKSEYASSITILEPDCSQWAAMIEANALQRHHLQEQIDNLCDAGADVIVLGCTHYHWIEQEINQAAAGRAMILQPEQAVIAQLQRVLAKL